MFSNTVSIFSFNSSPILATINHSKHWKEIDGNMTWKRIGEKERWFLVIWLLTIGVKFISNLWKNKKKTFFFCLSNETIIFAQKYKKKLSVVHHRSHHLLQFLLIFFSTFIINVQEMRHFKALTQDHLNAKGWRRF